MLQWWKRHPFAVDAFFRRSLVLTYAFPTATLEPLLAPGLALDCFRGCGFLAIAMVETERLRLAGLPEALGASFFLCGYRIFTRLAGGRGSLRGLQIIRSYTDRRPMILAGNLFTRYRYGHCRVEIAESDGRIEYRLRTRDGSADLDVEARSGAVFGPPFTDAREARRFAGPLPFTFSYEGETHSVVRVRGARERWNPEPVTARVSRNTFLEQTPFRNARGVLASAFIVRAVHYHWERGVREPI